MKTQWKKISFEFSFNSKIVFQELLCVCVCFSGPIKIIQTVGIVLSLIYGKLTVGTLIQARFIIKLRKLISDEDPNTSNNGTSYGLCLE